MVDVGQGRIRMVLKGWTALWMRIKRLIHCLPDEGEDASHGYGFFYDRQHANAVRRAIAERQSELFANRMVYPEMVERMLFA